MSFRTLSKQITGVEGVWLQAAVLSAHSDEQIDLETYSNAVYALAVQKHGHLSFFPQILLRLCEQYVGLEKYKAAISFIGCPMADIWSHLNVTDDFLKMLWATKLSYLLKCQATNLILERMCVMMKPHVGSIEVLDGLARNNPGEYIRGWIRGHYFVET